ncbi:hypothetical protein A2U01_0072444, partial [Trifolium medium]|nr:hypothetical protein [Trifolium medium]
PCCHMGAALRPGLPAEAV